MPSPTQHSLKYLRDKGCVCQVVERWNSFAKIRQDLFGGIDIVALEEGHPGVLGVQACAVASQAARTQKLLEEPRLKVWLVCGNRLQVWGWGKHRDKRLNKDGSKRKGDVRTVTITEILWDGKELGTVVVCRALPV